jgi:uncharacterized membrane protein YdjX (TVP38/TMEM64 family)
MLVVYLTGAYHHLSFEALKENRQLLMSIVSAHPYLAPVVFILVYIISTALSIPGGIYLSIAGGFLFPQPYCTLYVVIGGTLGAIAIFLASKTALGGYLKEKLKEQVGHSLLQRMGKKFHEEAAHYLLFLRIVPIFPFWMVNLAPAFFEVSLFTFAWTTFVGIIPGSFVFTQAGVGLGKIFDMGETLSLKMIFNTQVKIALIALGIFVLLPLIIKKFRKDKEPSIK